MVEVRLRRVSGGVFSTGQPMNALVTGIAAFFLFALGAICPHDFIYVPALRSIIVVGGYVGGTIFSLQSDGVYALHIRAGRSTANASDARLGGIWTYGLVPEPAAINPIPRELREHLRQLRLILPVITNAVTTLRR